MTSAFTLILAMAASSESNVQVVPEEPKGIIGRSQEDGKPVIWRFVNEAPSDERRERLPWLAIIAWTYDGGERNGMPLHDENQRMISLETTLRENVESPDLCTHAYSRTGNNRKELVYYISDRDEFMQSLNAALRSHPRYPIAIDFYEDPEWKDFAALRDRFANATKAPDESPTEH